jgi:NDP-sugar pyrophosphorylase family protein
MKLCPVAILAGGIATRLGTVTQSTPKAMLKVSGKPFIFWQLELLREQGVQEVILLVGHLSESIQSAVGDGSQFGLRVSYSHDGQILLGTGGAIKNALNLLGGEFFILYGDSYLLCDFGAVYKYFLHTHSIGLMTVFKNDSEFDKSNVVYEDGRIIQYDKNIDHPKMKFIDYGLGILRAEAFESFNDTKRFDLSEVYKKLIAEQKMSAYVVRKRFYEIGSHKGLAELRALLPRIKRGD